jgi:hypothetical protein
MRTITIEIDDSGQIDVREGDRYCNGLGWDEMLGTIAELTHPRIGSARYAMRTAEEWEAWRERITVRKSEMPF